MDEEFFSFSQNGDTLAISKVIDNHQGILRYLNDTAIYTFRLLEDKYAYEYLICTNDRIIKDESIYAFLRKQDNGVDFEMIGDDWAKFGVVIFDFNDTDFENGDTIYSELNSLFLADSLIKDKRLLGLASLLLTNNDDTGYRIRTWELYLNIDIKIKFQKFFRLEELYFSD